MTSASSPQHSGFTVLSTVKSLPRLFCAYETVLECAEILKCESGRREEDAVAVAVAVTFQKEWRENCPPTSGMSGPRGATFSSTVLWGVVPCNLVESYRLFLVRIEANSKRSTQNRWVSGLCPSSRILND
jgi:hypothetical protein